MINPEKVRRLERRKDSFRAKRHTLEALRIRGLRLRKAQLEARQKMQGITGIKNRKGSTDANTQKRRQIINKSVPLSRPKRIFATGRELPIPPQTKRGALTLAELDTRYSFDAVPEKVEIQRHQHPSQGNVRLRRRVIRENVERQRSKGIKIILQKYPLLRANQPVVRAIVAELGLKITRPVDLTPTVLAYLRKNYPSLVEQFKSRQKIKLTRFLGPATQKWKTIWAQFRRETKYIRTLETEIREINAFLDWEWKTVRDIEQEDREKGSWRTKNPRRKEVEQRRKAIEKKYPDVKVNWGDIYTLSRILETTERGMRKISGEINSFNEDLEHLISDRPDKTEELMRMRRLPNIRGTEL